MLVVIPYRVTDAHRAAALAWVQGRWAALGFPVRLGVHEEGPWCKAEAVRSGISDSTADVLVVADADCMCDGVSAAIDLVRDGAPWAMPHYLVHRLSPEATKQVLASGHLSEDLPLDIIDQKPYKGTDSGGIVVLRRDVWDDCPLDPRFKGWGHEDDSWGRALTTLYGKPARPAPPFPRLFHLWHPSQERQSRGYGCEESHLLNQRYVRAWATARQTGDPAPMRALIEEAR